MSKISNSEFSKAVVGRIEKVLAPTGTPIPLHAPEFSGNEWNYVKECLDTGWVSSVGSYVDRFERDLASYTNSPFAVVTVNGTAALHIACILSGVKAEDEVLVPALTFVATVNAIAYTSATPHFVDVEERTLGVDAEKLRLYLKEIAAIKGEVCVNKNTGRVIRALVVMHTFGHPVDLDALSEVCSEFKIRLIEDAAEALGSEYRGRALGTFSEIGALSFNGNKVVTTGGGGALLIRDAKVAKLAKHLTTTGIVPHSWEFFHDMLAYNYRMPNINAALGCAQLELLPDFIARKRALAIAYDAAFSDLDGLKYYKEIPGAKSNYWLNTLILNSADSSLRDAILIESNERGIMCRPIWKLMTELPMYAQCPKMDLTVSKGLSLRIINIPSGPSLVSGANF